MTIGSPTIARIKRANPALVRSWLKRRAQTALARAGYLITKLDDDSIRYVAPSFSDEVPPPARSEEALRPDHPRLRFARCLRCPRQSGSGAHPMARLVPEEEPLAGLVPG